MRRRLQILLGAVGAVAAAAGTSAVVRGTGGVTGRNAPSGDASVDSELRFFAAWYVIAGIVMMRAARAPEHEGATVRLISSGWAIAAAGRLLSMKASGRPHPLYSALTGAEVAIAACLAWWARGGESRLLAEADESVVG
jgi:hypothetical protein